MGDSSSAALLFGESALTLASAYTQATAQQEQARYEAEIARQNAAFARTAGRDALRRGEQAAGRRGIEAQREIGAQRAAFAGQGVSVAEGTPLELQARTAQIGAEDAAAIRANAWKEAFGHSALGFEARRRMALRAGLFGAEATLLTGLTRVAGRTGEFFRDREG
jgi:hypothetical protein